MFSVDFHSYVTMNHRPNSHIQQKQVCYGKAMNQKTISQCKKSCHNNNARRLVEPMFVVFLLKI